MTGKGNVIDMISRFLPDDFECEHMFITFPDDYTANIVLTNCDDEEFGESKDGLLPCPFCGQKVEMEEYVLDSPVTFADCGFEIRCAHCGIKFREHTRHLPECDKQAAEKARNKLAKRWNTRHHAIGG